MRPCGASRPVAAGFGHLAGANNSSMLTARDRSEIQRANGRLDGLPVADDHDREMVGVDVLRAPPAGRRPRRPPESQARTLA